ncbi:CvpA family protein [Lentilactobacillus senioris]|uniref:CvpA family protein n=1 Tax=Lentilactobacillus senioris TaxID=931534 RepID=UPI002280BFAC|nr:CvpA family protein [Lentilactobacillus senioris]MCY9807328.1 CvpA family protein [Lentilactobacillus senioris]
MVLNIVIIIILLISILSGIRRGFVHEIINLIGYGLSIFGGLLIARPINLLIQDWLNTNTDLSPFIIFGLKNVIFFGIFASIWTIFRIIKRTLMPIKSLPIIGPLNGALGGLASFLLTYLIIFVVVFITHDIPITSWQTSVENSEVAQWILTKTPIISNQIFDLWQNYGGDIRI